MIISEKQKNLPVKKWGIVLRNKSFPVVVAHAYNPTLRMKRPDDSEFETNLSYSNYKTSLKIWDPTSNL